MGALEDAGITEDSSLRDIQKYIWRINHERGFNVVSAEKRMLLLTEEVGEVAKAIRKLANLKFTESTKQTDLADEIADVLIVLSGLASITGIDMYDALSAKEEKNSQRVWK